MIEGAPGFGLRLRVHQGISRRAQQDGPRGSAPLLHMRCHVEGFSNRRREPLQVIPKTTDDNQARMEPHARAARNSPASCVRRAGKSCRRWRSSGAANTARRAWSSWARGGAKDGREACTRRRAVRVPPIGMQHLLGQPNDCLKEGDTSLLWAKPRRQGRCVGQCHSRGWSPACVPRPALRPSAVTGHIFFFFFF